MEFNVNGASAEESKNGINVNLSTSAFGDVNKENVNNLKARVCGTDGLACYDLEKDYGFLYFSINIKIKEGFEDTHNTCESTNAFLKKMMGEGEISKGNV